MLTAGEFPWVEGASNATITAAHRHYAQRYRHLMAQHQRSLEEQTLLRAEVILAFNGLEEQEAAIAARLVELQPAGPASNAGDAAVGTGSATGHTGGGGEGGASSAAMNSGTGGEGQGSSREQWRCLLAGGEAVMHTIEQRRLQQIHAEAHRLLSEHKPVTM